MYVAYWHCKNHSNMNISSVLLLELWSQDRKSSEIKTDGIWTAFLSDSGLFLWKSTPQSRKCSSNDLSQVFNQFNFLSYKLKVPFSVDLVPDDDAMFFECFSLQIHSLLQQCPNQKRLWCRGKSSRRFPGCDQQLMIPVVDFLKLCDSEVKLLPKKT